MCGRYTLYSEKEDLEIKRIVATVNQCFDGQMKTGDILPSDLAPVICKNYQDNHLSSLVLMNWGYQNPAKKGLIINARSETILEKRLFHNDFKNRRCLIPATGFYEWDAEKNQHLFQSDELLYLAGIHTNSKYINKFVILTKPPNEIVQTVHNRMPVLIPASQKDEWLNDLATAVELTKSDHISLIEKPTNQTKVNTQIRFPFYEEC